MDYNAELARCASSPISRWAEGNAEVDYPPWLVYINPTNLCNNRCRVCGHPQAMRPQRGLMAMDTFRRIVDQLPTQVRKVYLLKQGEPFLHPRLEDMVAYLRQRLPQVHIGIHTNGIVARPPRLAKVLPLLDSLGFSISAISPETYKRVHGTNAFQAVSRNLQAVSRLLLDMAPGQRPHVFIDYVHQRLNADEDEQEVVAYFRQRYPGLSSVDFHFVYNYQGETQEGNLRIYEELPYTQFPTCVFPWSSITFCHDGKVSYCFVEPREGRFLGDINQQSFNDIWHGGQYRRFREAMAAHRLDELAEDGFFCHKCSWLWTPKSQSPRNLQGGYSTQIGQRREFLPFGDLLEIPLEQAFQEGVEAYLRGEVAYALGCFQLVEAAQKDKPAQSAARRMLHKCRQVLARYRDLGLWKETMSREGDHAQDRVCRYYKLRG